MIASMAAALVTRGLAATDAECIEILQRALDAGNPPVRWAVPAGKRYLATTRE